MGYKGILHVNRQSAGGTANTDWVIITKPVGLQVNDLLLGFFLAVPGDTVFAPAGWTQLDADSSTNMQSVVFYKIATTTEVNAASFTFTASSALGPFCGGLSAYRYVDTANPFNVQGQGIDNAGTDPVTTPGVTTTQPALLVHYLSSRVASTTIPTFTATGVTERADFGNHGNTISYAMAWYDSGTTVTAGVKTGVSINPTGTTTQTVARTLALQAMTLDSTDTASTTETGGLAFVVTQTDTATGTERPPTIRTSTVSNVDAVTRNETQSITGTWDSPFPDTATATDIGRVRLYDADQAFAILEKAVVNDQNHPNRSDTGSLSNESNAITAYISSRDVFFGNEFQVSPGGVAGTIRDYRATLIQGPANIYVADYGAIEPVGLGVINPPPAAYWTHVGGTNSGVTIRVTHDWDELEMKNISDRPGRRLKKRRIEAETELAEPTLENLVYAYANGAVTNYAGYKVYLPPASVDRATPLTYKSVIIHGWAPGLRADGTQKRRMIIMRKCLVTGSTKMAYDKEDQTVIAITWAIHRVSNSISPFAIIDET